MRNDALRSALLAAIALTASPIARAQVVTMKYVVTDLGNLSGQPGGLVNGNAINAAGQVVGSSTNAQGKTHAFRTAPNRPIRNTDDLGTFGGDYSAAWAINNLGQAAGDADYAAVGTDPPVRRGFRLDADGTIVDLGTLVPTGGTVFGSNSSGARGINDTGQVVGLARVPADACGSVSHAFRTEPNATIVSSPSPPFADDLGTLVPPPYSNCRSSIAYAINSAGVAVGDSATVVSTGWPNHAFRTAPLVYRIDLNEFGWGNSTAYAVNDLGETVGFAQTAVSTVGPNPFSPSPHAFMSMGDITHRSIDLGTLGGTYSIAYAINYRYPSDSQVVGDAYITGDTAQHAFIWTGDVFNGGTMIDLNTLISASTGWELTSARGINNKGQIVAAGRRAGAPFVYLALRLDPADAAVQVLIGSLGDASYGLSGGQVSSLTDKLTNAYNSIQQGLFKQATNQLNAAIKWVQTAVSGGNMSFATGTALIAAMNAIIAVL